MDDWSGEAEWNPGCTVLAGNWPNTSPFIYAKEDKGAQNMERIRLFGVVKKCFLCISIMRYFQIFQHLSLSLNITLS